MKAIFDRDFLLFKIGPVVLFAIAIYFPVFLHLGSDVIGMWDESLFALRAYFLAYTDQYLINFNEIDPTYSHPNTKPPLFTWIQAISFRLFGYSELSLRMPIALSVVAMIIFLVWFSKKEFNAPTIGYIAALVLVTSRGFMDLHIARTGDHDAVLAFEFLLVFANFYRAIKYPDKQNRYIWYTAIFLTAAVLTKSVAGLFPLPALFLFALYKKKLIDILRSWQTWGAVAMFLALVLGYYLYREMHVPGFLKTVWDEEIGGRYSGDALGHHHIYYYYLKRLIEWRLVPMVFILPLSILIFFTKRGKDFRDLGILFLIGAISLLTIISISKTKCEWYDAGVFPLLAVLVAIGIDHVRVALQGYFANETVWRKHLVTLLLIAALFTYPYIKVMQQIAYPSKGWNEEQIGEFMRQVDPEMEYTIATKGLNLCVMYYKRIATNIDGIDIQHKRYKDDFEVGEKIMCYKDVSWAEKRYKVKTLQKFKKVKLIEIQGIKEEPNNNE